MVRLPQLPRLHSGRERLHTGDQLRRREVAVTLGLDERLAQQRAVTGTVDEPRVVVLLLDGNERIGDRLDIELGNLQMAVGDRRLREPPVRGVVGPEVGVLGERA